MNTLERLRQLAGIVESRPAYNFVSPEDILREEVEALAESMTPEWVEEQGAAYSAIVEYVETATEADLEEEIAALQAGTLDVGNELTEDDQEDDSGAEQDHGEHEPGSKRAVAFKGFKRRSYHTGRASRYGNATRAHKNPERHADNPDARHRPEVDGSESHKGDRRQRPHAIAAFHHFHAALAARKEASKLRPDIEALKKKLDLKKLSQKKRDAYQKQHDELKVKHAQLDSRMKRHTLYSRVHQAHAGDYEVNRETGHFNDVEKGPVATQRSVLDKMRRLRHDPDPLVARVKAKKKKKISKPKPAAKPAAAPGASHAPEIDPLS